MVQDKTHYIAVTGIIHKNGKYLICKRSPNEKAFPSKWCVPGGKMKKDDFAATPKDTKDHWFDVFEKTLIREIKEETNLDVEITKLIDFREAIYAKHGYHTIIFFFHAKPLSDDMKFSKEILEANFFTKEEARALDLVSSAKWILEKHFGE